MVAELLCDTLSHDARFPFSPEQPADRSFPSVDVADGVARQPHAAAAARDFLAGHRLRRRRAGGDSFAEGERADGHRDAGEIAARFRSADFLAPAGQRRGLREAHRDGAERQPRDGVSHRCSTSRPAARGWCRCAGSRATIRFTARWRRCRPMRGGSLPTKPGILLEPALLDQFQAKVGDKVKLGESSCRSSAW